MPIDLNPTGESVSLGTTIPENAHAVSDGSNLLESDLKEYSDRLETSKDVYCNSINVASTTVSIGPALSLSAGGNEMLQRSIRGDDEYYSMIPAKKYDSEMGTEGLTTGRALSEAENLVLYPYDSLRSDDVTATSYPNTVSGKIIYRATPLENRFITQYFMRFATAQTGIRVVVQVGSLDGEYIYESEPEYVYNSGIGLESVVYDGTEETEVIIDLEESPLVLYAGYTYYITIESSLGDVVAYGGLVEGEFKPYTRRDIQTLAEDPVVATEVIKTSTDLDLTGVILVFNDSSRCDG